MKKIKFIVLILTIEAFFMVYKKAYSTELKSEEKIYESFHKNLADSIKIKDSLEYLFKNIQKIFNDIRLKNKCADVLNQETFIQEIMRFISEKDFEDNKCFSMIKLDQDFNEKQIVQLLDFYQLVNSRKIQLEKDSHYYLFMTLLLLRAKNFSKALKTFRNFENQKEKTKDLNYVYKNLQILYAKYQRGTGEVLLKDL